MPIIKKRMTVSIAVHVSHPDKCGDECRFLLCRDCTYICALFGGQTFFGVPHLDNRPKRRPECRKKFG